MLTHHGVEVVPARSLPSGVDTAYRRAFCVMPDDVDLEFLSALGHPVRLKAMVLFERAPGSARELAEAVDLSPTAATHHVNVLKRVGLIRVVEKRRRRGYMESVYAPTAPGWADIHERLAALARASRRDASDG